MLSASPAVPKILTVGIASARSVVRSTAPDSVSAAISMQSGASIAIPDASAL